MNRWAIIVAEQVFLMLVVLVPAGWSLTDVYFGLDDGAALGTSGPIIGHYTYDGQYFLTGIQSVAAGAAVDNIVLNSNPGTTGGIFAGLTGSSNVLREYSFNGSSFSSVREGSATIGDFGIGPDNRLYGIDRTSGSLVNYAANGATFTQNALPVNAAGGNVQVEVGSKPSSPAVNQIVIAGVNGAGTRVDLTTYTFDGGTFTPLDSSGSDFRPTALAISPLDNTIWAPNTVSVDPSAKNKMLQFAFTDDIPGGAAGCSSESLPCAIGVGHLGSTQDFLVGPPVITDLAVNSAGIAIGISEDFDAGEAFGGRGTYLLGWLGNPHTIGGGNGSVNLKIATRLAVEGTPFDLAVDDEDIVHVLGDGMLQAWEITDDDGNISTGALFQAIAVTGDGLLGAPRAIAAAAGAFPIGNGDYNGDDMVNAADYTVWRDTLGQMVTPANGADGNGNGQVGPEDYDFWKSRFGNVIGIGSVASAGVPEPATSLLLAVGMVGLIAGIRHRTTLYRDFCGPCLSM